MSDGHVLVVGAGPTGLLMAIMLKTLAPSLPFEIIDKVSGPGTTSRAMVVHARTIEFYRMLGLADELLEQGQQLVGADMKVNGNHAGSLKFGNLSTDVTKYPFALAYPQDKHERLLLRRVEALGIKVQWNTPLDRLVQHKDHVEATYAGKTRTFSYVTGCDGAHSGVRHSTSIKMSGGTYPHVFFVADAYVDGVTDPKKLYTCPGSTGFGLYIPLDDHGHVRVFHTVKDAGASKANFDTLRPEIEEHTGLRFKSVSWQSVYKVHHLVADAFQDGRCFLLGDAAHQHSPVGGQGMNTGLGDVMNLSWKLAAVWQGTAKPDILKTYAEERISFARSLVATTDSVFSYVTGDGWIGWFIRRWFMSVFIPPLFKTTFFPTKLFQTVSQTQIQYPDSPLSQGTTATIHAGMRLPWVEYGATDNFASMKPPRWQIHRYAAGSDSYGASEWTGYPLSTFELSEDAKHKGFEAKTLYLIRPDGYIGCICPENDKKPLSDYVAKWKLSPTIVK